MEAAGHMVLTDVYKIKVKKIRRFSKKVELEIRAGADNPKTRVLNEGDSWHHDLHLNID